MNTRPNNVLAKTAIIGVVFVVAGVVIPPLTSWIADDPARVAALAIGVAALIALAVTEATR